MKKQKKSVDKKGEGLLKRQRCFRSIYLQQIEKYGRGKRSFLSQTESEGWGTITLTYLGRGWGKTYWVTYVHFLGKKGFESIACCIA